MAEVNSKIDKDVMETMLKEQIDLGIKDETQIARCELNFFAELLGQLRESNKKLDHTYRLINMIGADKLTEYMKELTTNVKREETIDNIAKKIEKGHKRKSKVQNDTIKC